MALQALCTLWFLRKTQRIHGPDCFTYPGKNKAIPMN